MTSAVVGIPSIHQEIPTLNSPSSGFSWQKVDQAATGALAAVVSLPLISGVMWGVQNLMLKWGCDLTPSQDFVTLWNSIALNPTPWNVALLTAFVAYATIFGPLLEEWLFRDKLYGVLEEEIKTPALRVIISGILFGAIHLSPFQGWTNVPIFIGTGLMGIMLASLRETHGNTVGSSTAHIVNNSLAMGLLLLR